MYTHYHTSPDPDINSNQPPSKRHPFMKLSLNNSTWTTRVYRSLIVKTVKTETVVDAYQKKILSAILTTIKSLLKKKLSANGKAYRD